MPEKPVFLQLADELMEESRVLIKEIIEEDGMADMVAYYKEKERKIFEKAFQELKELEEEV